MPESRKLRVFLCHASHDKPIVRELYQKLKAEGWIDPWLDEEKLYPGQDWDLEIEKAVEAADAVIVFLSNNSVSKEGYVQRELRFVLRIADFKPEGTVFVIPVRLDDCPLPRRLSMWQAVDYFPENRKDWAYRRLLGSLKVRAGKLDILTKKPPEKSVYQKAEEWARGQVEIEEQAKKEQEERERKEKEAREKAARESAEKAEQERIEREGLERGEKAREEKKESSRKEPEICHESPSSGFGRGAKGEGRKPAWPPYAIGAGVLLGSVILFGVGSLIQQALTPSGSEPPPTETLITSVPSDTSEELGVGSTMISDKDGMTLVYVPAGEFKMGSENGSDAEKPVHTVYLDAFWIDQTEVTNAMFMKFIDATGYETDAQKSGSSWVYQGSSWLQVSAADWRHPSGPESNITKIMDYPVVHVSWNDANAYCSWVNRQLPSEAEWEKAASWDEENQTKYAYSWGNSIDCTQANYWGKDGGCVGHTTSVGSYESGKSPYGVYDIVGNVWEWLADWYNDNYYQNSSSTNPLGPDTGQYRVLRGGSWFNSNEVLRTNVRYWSDPLATDVSIGFRCALSAFE